MHYTPSSRGAIPVATVCLLLAVAPAMAAKPKYVLRGAEPEAHFGEAIGGVGDVNGDGAADFIAGEPLSDGATGRAVVYSGGTGDVIYELSGSGSGTRFGYSAAGLGDVSGDGVPDFAVGAPLEGVGGRVRVYSGADGSVLYALDETEPDAKFGANVNSAGDIDNDGVNDLAVTAPSAGRVTLLSGADGRFIRRHEGFQGVLGVIRCSHCVHSGGGEIRLVARSAGDVDADGFVDLLVADTWADDSLGEVFLFSGRDGERMHKWRGQRSGSSYFGFSVDSIEDLDGDGHREILIGINGTWAGAFYGGEVQVMSGRTGKQLRRHLPPTDGHAYMGRAVRGVPDMNGDGVEDYLVGLPYRKKPSFLRGEAWLFSGKTGEVLAIMRGPRNKKRAGWQPQFGYFLEAIGDINGDRVPDLAVSAPGERAGEGAVRVYSGRKLLKR